MDLRFFTEIVIILSVSVGIVYIFNKLKLPSIIGFLLTGILIGPNVLQFIHSKHEVEIFSEIGVVLILFTIGIEFSLRKLLRLKKEILIGGAMQFIVSAAVITAVSMLFFNLPMNESLFIGFLVGLSSTAIVLRILQKKAALDTPHGKISLSILIFQDLAIVPLILFTPLLAGTSLDVWGDIANLLIKLAILAVILIVLGKWVIPFILNRIVHTRNKELFLISVILICLLIVWITHLFGVSIALGAFIAGLIISETDFSYQALGNIIPFKELFSGFFFVSVGMLFNPMAFIDNLGIILILLVTVMLVKIVAASSASLLLGYPMKTSLLVSFTIFQIGEFSFILSKTGLESGLLGGEHYQLFLAIAIITMIMTPFLIEAAPKGSEMMTNILPFKKFESADTQELPAGKLENHLIIIGYGFNGKNLANTAEYYNITSVIIEMNPQTVKREKARGRNIIYGDAANETVLDHAAIKSAAIAVIVISDMEATRKIVEKIKELNPAIHLIARTRFVTEIARLHDLGADEVIPEEFETSLKLFDKVLIRYNVPEHAIESLIAEFREKDYEKLRRGDGN